MSRRRPSFSSAFCGADLVLLELGAGLAAGMGRILPCLRFVAKTILAPGPGLLVLRAQMLRCESAPELFSNAVWQAMQRVTSGLCCRRSKLIASPQSLQTP